MLPPVGLEASLQQIQMRSFFFWLTLENKEKTPTLRHEETVRRAIEFDGM